MLAKESTATPKSHDGIVEALRYLTVARKSAVKARTQTINQIRALLVSAPDEIRSACYLSSTLRCVEACKRLAGFDEDLQIKTLSAMLILLANRWFTLTDELKIIDKDLKKLTKKAAPHLLEQFGIGPYVSATLLVAAGDNAQRLKKESSFAALCGVSPIEASSGKKQRHRLNRGGSREANNALWTIALIRMRSDPRTRVYVARRVSQGKTEREVQRCLKRYIAREVYPLIVSDLSMLT